MDAGAQTVARGGALEEVEEGGPLFGGEGGEEFGVEGFDDSFGPRQEGVGGGEEVDGVGAAVGGMPTAFDQAASLEVVDQGDHHVAVDIERLAEFLLGAAVVLAEQLQHAEMPGLDVERGEQVGEPVRGMEAQLADEEGGVGGQRGGGIGHTARIPNPCTSSDCTLV